MNITVAESLHYEITEPFTTQQIKSNFWIFPVFACPNLGQFTHNISIFVGLI